VHRKRTYIKIKIPISANLGGSAVSCGVWIVGMASNATSGHACPAPMKPTSNGVFQGDNPLDFALPLAILQICLVLVVSRGLAYLLKPLRQPRVIAEIIVSSFLFHLVLINLIILAYIL